MNAYEAGKNIMRLLVAEAEHDYSDAHGWAGYRQWLDAGRVVRKGEHGTIIAAMGTAKVEDSAGNVTVKTFPGKSRRVFHYDQTVELDADTALIVKMELEQSEA